MDVSKKGFGFRPGPHDPRDIPLARAMRAEEPIAEGSRFYPNPMQLDQGETSECVGFGWTQFYNSAPVQHHETADFAEILYRRATDLDEYLGSNWRDSEGTSIRAGAKAAREAGMIDRFAFTRAANEVVLWLLNRGPVVIGVDWHEGMDEPDPKQDYFVKPTGEVRSGHCVLLDGVRFFRNSDENYVRIKNSWGEHWGYNGRCRTSVSNLAYLLSKEGAVACTSVEKGVT